MQKLKVAVVQTDLYWENPEANRAMLEEKISSLPPIDLIVLPEMFTTGFTMNTALAEPMNLFTTKWMKLIAAQKQAVVVGSLGIKEGNKHYNRAIWMRSDGTYETYDKRHLFRMGGENNAYAIGQKQLVVELNGWKIAPFICYDLRFPVWCRNRNLAYDLTIFMANWPTSRNHVWDVLLKARALENQVFCIGANRIGIDGRGFAHDGHSMVVDFKGFEIANAGIAENIIIVELDKAELDSFRTQFPVYLDADDFKL